MTSLNQHQNIHADNYVSPVKGENAENEIVTFSVIGLLVSVEYQKCKYTVESLHQCYPEKYEEPILRPMLDVEWNAFLSNEKRSKGGPLWSITKCVLVYYNGNFIGDDTALCKYVSTRYILPMKNFYEIGQEALSQYLKELMRTNRKCIYLTIMIDQLVIGSMVFMLYNDLVPKTCQLFLKRCKKLKGGYSGTPIHRIVESSWIQCGGYDLKEIRMPCENYAVSHSKRGVLSMCNSGPNKNNSTQFLITLADCGWMDTRYVAFGQMLYGDDILSQIAAVPTHYQSPQKEVRIKKADEFLLTLPKLDDDRNGEEFNEFLDKRLRRKKFKNYYTKTELNLEKAQKVKNNVVQDCLETDMRSHYPMNMLPTNIQEAFNYVPGKTSSCMFEVENCYKCGCSHDVGKCLERKPSDASRDD